LVGQKAGFMWTTQKDACGAYELPRATAVTDLLTQKREGAGSAGAKPERRAL
jgi:hypothetical protein